MYKIEKDVEIPPAKHSAEPRKRKTYQQYPFAQMVVGDSFFAPNSHGPAYAQRNVVMAAKRFRDQHKESVVFATRQVDGGVRVWRIS